MGGTCDKQHVTIGTSSGYDFSCQGTTPIIHDYLLAQGTSNALRDLPCREIAASSGGGGDATELALLALLLAAGRQQFESRRS